VVPICCLFAVALLATSGIGNLAYDEASSGLLHS
jgi:hypothetical protein